MLLLAALLPLLAAQPNHYGLPACAAPHLELAVRSGFTLCHDATRKVPAWTAYKLTPAQLSETPLPRLRHFRPDTFLSHAGSSNQDYAHSGFHRGHLVPARDLAFSPDSLRASFLLSNAAPQTASLNSGRMRQLENTVRDIAASADAVYVITGTLFESPEPGAIGPNHVAVPSHFFKAILVIRGSQKFMLAAILPNSSRVAGTLPAYLTTVDEVERRSGLDLFSSLEDSEESILEAQPFELSLVRKINSAPVTH